MTQHQNMHFAQTQDICVSLMILLVLVIPFTSINESNLLDFMIDEAACESPCVGRERH
jgi:hypothetical protein